MDETYAGKAKEPVLAFDEWVESLDLVDATLHSSKFAPETDSTSKLLIFSSSSTSF